MSKEADNILDQTLEYDRVKQQKKSAKLNTESDKSIDTTDSILELLSVQIAMNHLEDRGIVSYQRRRKEDDKNVETAKAQLLAEILKGAETFEVKHQCDKDECWDYETKEAIPTQYIIELFNVKGE